MIAAGLLAAPALAFGAAPLDSATAALELDTPLFQVQSWTQVPPKFSTDARQAVAAAEASKTMQALHRRVHPLLVKPLVWAGRPLHWYIAFSQHGHVYAEADVSPAGRVQHVWTGPQAIATYARGHYGGLFDSWWIVVPFSLAFLLPFLDPRRLRRLLHLDALVLLSFMGSYALFDHSHIQSAVWLVYPPLLYLLARLTWIGFRGRRGSSGSSLLSTRTLWVGVLLLTGARVALGIVSHQIIDVGVASVVGAHRIVLGLPLYYNTAAHNDTYGPVAYLAYLPFELIFGWHGTWGFGPAAKAAPIAFDLVTIAGLIVLGRRLRGGDEGRRLGLKLAWAWAACPLTLLTLMVHTNDGLIAMLSVLSLLAFSSPAARGALLGMAAAAKFSPAGLLPLYARTRDRSLKGALACAVPFVAVVVLAIALYLPSGGLHYFYERTLGFQLTRTDIFSPWALHPTLDPIKTVLEVGALLLAVGVFFFPRLPRERPLVQVCALAGAVTIAVQLPAVHWFYFYVVWFVPFVLVALLGPWPPPARSGPAGEADQQPEAEQSAPAPELAVV